MAFRVSIRCTSSERWTRKSFTACRVNSSFSEWLAFDRFSWTDRRKSYCSHRSEFSPFTLKSVLGSIFPFSLTLCIYLRFTLCCWVLTRFPSFWSKFSSIGWVSIIREYLPTLGLYAWSSGSLSDRIFHRERVMTRWCYLSSSFQREKCS